MLTEKQFHIPVQPLYASNALIPNKHLQNKNNQMHI